MCVKIDRGLDARQEIQLSFFSWVLLTPIDSYEMICLQWYCREKERERGREEERERERERESECVRERYCVFERESV